MPETIFITTPIYYVNSVPHLGTALTTVVADITKRYFKMRGHNVFFLTGTDENGQKVKEAAEKLGKDPLVFVDEISARFREIFPILHVDFDDFIRTTEPRHHLAAQAFFAKLQENGHIYTGRYEGWYDVSSETFFKEADLVNGLSPDGNEVRWVSEENYFFRMSTFAEPLLKHIELNPQFIVPETRKNEVVSFIKQGLRDVCISRQNQGWGIPVPGDPSQVIYVWFDALINYVTATGWPNPGWETKWPAEVQVMGKDILTRFHATLWPAMLLGVGLPLPKTLFGHAWLLIGGEKISKSKGNVIAPLELAQDLAERSGCSLGTAIDAVRYYCTAIMPRENDAIFTPEDFDRRFNSDLANDLGNALNRSLAMSHKFAEGKVPDADPDPEALQAIETAKVSYSKAMETYHFEAASQAAIDLIRFLNKYIDRRAPWVLAKANDPALPSVIRSMLLCLRSAEALIQPVMPHAARIIAEQLGLSPQLNWDFIGTSHSLPSGTVLSNPQPIFPRLDLSKPTVKDKPKLPENELSPTPVPSPVVVTNEQISIEDFIKVKLRIGRIFEAEPVEGSDKLLKLQVVIDGEKRQIVAGIKSAYQPEDLIGRQVVVCVNLKPARLRGVESQGMLLAATDTDGAAILLQPDREAPEGANVK